jgi:formylglycine-generating enzyme required for sulfatase activity
VDLDKIRGAAYRRAQRAAAMPEPHVSDTLASAFGDGRVGRDEERLTPARGARGEIVDPAGAVDAYRIVRPLGSTGDGVFLAHDRKLDRAVVLRRLPASPDERAALLASAQALARVTHPSLCRVDRIREGGAAPCVVQGYERGERLSALPCPMPAEQARSLGAALAGALAALHAAQVAHGGVRADRIVLSPSGVPCLIGLRSVRARAGKEAMAADVRDLAEVLATRADGDLAALLRRFLATEGEGASAEALRRALESGVYPSDGGAEEDPYRGLRPFEAEHVGLFFGREPEIAAAVARLRGEPWLVVTAPSGAGKSSVVRAGIVPAITGGALGERRRWAAAILVPGPRPLAALSRALAPALGRQADALEHELRGDPALAGRLAGERPASEGGLVVVVDQLEEAMTLAEAGERSVFLAAIAGFSALTAGVRVLFTLRSDFLDRLGTIEPGPLGRSLLRATFVLPPMGEEALRQAVVGPARARGFDVEMPAMVDQLVAEGRPRAGGDALPLLSFVLAELWAERDRARRLLTAAALGRIGGAESAIARHGDLVLSLLSAEERRAARRVLLALVSPGETRARRSREELVAAGEGAGERALEALVRGRIVVAGEGYAIAHEALVRAWPKLRGWLDEASDERAAVRRLSEAAAEWERFGRDPALLWGARQTIDLDRALSLDGAGEGPRAFAEASRRAVRRAEVRRWALRVGAPLAALLLLAGVLGAVRWREQRQTRAFVAARMAEADAASREELAIEAQLEAARAAAFARFDADDRPGGEARWKEALDLARRASDAFDRASAPLGRAIARDPLDPVVRARAADLTYRRLLAAERDHDADLSRDLGARLAALDDDGSRRARLAAPAHLRVTTDPPGASVVLHAVHLDAELRRVEDEGRPMALGAPLSLTPGSYVLAASAPGRYPTRLPVLLGRGDTLELTIPLPASADVPPGMVFVPAGVSLLGAADAEGVRATFSAEPEHPAFVEAFLIGVNEVTYAEYLEFLAEIPAAERAPRRPHAADVDLGYDREGTPILTLGKVTARRDEPLCRSKRSVRRCQDWLRFPVAGVSAEDAQAYVQWLARGRLPGARRCTEREWERAARGADGRLFAHGDALRPGDANFAETYRADADMMGADAVGAFPADQSPFGVLDLGGNVREWVTNKAGRTARGGAWTGELTLARAAYRSVDRYGRNAVVGVRVCAAAPSTPR